MPIRNPFKEHTENVLVVVVNEYAEVKGLKRILWVKADAFSWKWNLSVG